MFCLDSQPPADGKGYTFLIASQYLYLDMELLQFLQSTGGRAFGRVKKHDISQQDKLRLILHLKPALA